jgi:hypothetical protein
MQRSGRRHGQTVSYKVAIGGYAAVPNVLDRIKAAVADRYAVERPQIHAENPGGLM